MFLVPVTRSSADLGRGLDRLFDDTLERYFGVAPQAEQGLRSPALDVTESDRAYTVHLDMPGVAKSDVKIAIEGKRVSVEAQTRSAAEKKEGDRVLYRERAVARYARSFTLPCDIDQAESEARMDNGVLTLNLAKRRANGATQLTVN